MRVRNALTILAGLGLLAWAAIKRSKPPVDIPVSFDLDPDDGQQQVGDNVYELVFVTPDGRKVKAALEPSFTYGPFFAKKTHDPSALETK